MCVYPIHSCVKFCVVCVLLMILLFCNQLHANTPEEQCIRHVQSYLTIRDYSSAVAEAERSLQIYPHSCSLYESYILSLAKTGDEKKLLNVWEIFAQKFPEKSNHRELIEEMAWGILNKASLSHSIIMRGMSLLAAYFSKQGQGVNILYRGMKDPNYAVRAMAVKLTAHFRDEKLVEEVKRLFKVETVWIVREEILEAIGSMKITSLRDDLEAIIASDHSHVKEKALAMASLLELMETINRPEIERLCANSRAGLRQLGCQAIAHFQSQRDLDQLFFLVKDPQPDVRFAAFQALGQLHPTQMNDRIISLAQKGTKDGNYQVAISAAWLLTLYSSEAGQREIARFLKDRRREVRYFAVSALRATGLYGIKLIVEQFTMHADPYVRLNLALALIGQRQFVDEAATLISRMLMTENDKWAKRTKGLFQAIVNIPSEKTNDSMSSPEMDNQLIRLELLNLLAVLKVPQVQNVIRGYLLERSWEISGVASALLLTEGDETAIGLVENLLYDSQPRVRLQAALILSLWSHEESPIQILEEEYEKGDWDVKAKILEGIGRIGSTRSIPFLIRVLKEPSQTLRLIAAMAIIQCVNH